MLTSTYIPELWVPIKVILITITRFLFEQTKVDKKFHYPKNAALISVLLSNNILVNSAVRFHSVRKVVFFCWSLTAQSVQKKR